MTKLTKDIGKFSRIHSLMEWSYVGQHVKDAYLKNKCQPMTVELTLSYNPPYDVDKGQLSWGLSQLPVLPGVTYEITGKLGDYYVAPRREASHIPVVQYVQGVATVPVEDIPRQASRA